MCTIDGESAVLWPQERFADWNVKFGGSLDKSVVMLTGDTATDLKLLASAHIVITTPQRWDVLSRRWRVRKPVQAVALYIVDELHLIGGEAGPTLEVYILCTRPFAALSL